MDRSTLNKATTADDTPTPGYMYTEIAKSTFAAPDAGQQLADYLLKKLEKDNPHVKLKVLRIIKHVCEQGKPDFRRALQKRADVVKSCLQYRGTPDVLKGDAPNKAVREEADFAVKAIFSHDTAANAYGTNTEQAKKMQGFGSEGNPDDGNSRMGQLPSQARSFGSDGMSGGGQSGGPKASGMTGFGNPNFDNSAPAEGGDSATYKMAQSAMASVGGALKGYLPGAAASSGSASGYSGAPGDQNSNTYRPPPSGPGMGGGGGGGGGFGSGDVQGRWGGGGGGGGGGASGARQPAANSGSSEYETRLVGELCAPGGPRVAPSAAALDDFCRKAESLNPTALADQLRRKLMATGDQSWQIRLKALHAVEALVNHRLDGVVGHISQFSSEALFEAQEIPQCRQKASKVLHLLGFIEQPEERPSGRSAAADVSAPTATAMPPMDLLDMDDSPPPAAAAVVSAAAATSTDLLQGGPASAPSASAGGMLDMLDLGGGMPQAAPLHAAPAESQGGSLFGGLSMSGAALASAEAQQPVAAPVLASGGDGGGLFGSLQLSGSAAPAAAPGVPTGGGDAPGMFGGAMVPTTGPAPAAVSSGMPSGIAQAQAAQQASQFRTSHLGIFSGGGQNPMQMQGGMPGMQGMQGMQGMPGAFGMQQPMQVMQPMQGMQAVQGPCGMQPMQPMQGGMQGMQPMMMQPMGQQPGGMQPGGMQPMGMQPMGMQPMQGGMQPMQGGMQPMQGGMQHMGQMGIQGAPAHMGGMGGMSQMGGMGGYMQCPPGGMPGAMSAPQMQAPYPAASSGLPTSAGAPGQGPSAFGFIGGAGGPGAPGGGGPEQSQQSMAMAGGRPVMESQRPEKKQSADDSAFGFVAGEMAGAVRVQ